MAQTTERAHNPKVAGSNPAPATKRTLGTPTYPEGFLAQRGWPFLVFYRSLIVERWATMLNHGTIKPADVDRAAEAVARLAISLVLTPSELIDTEDPDAVAAFAREVLLDIDFTSNSDDFIFDNQMLAQIIWHGHTIGEISCPAKYFAEASSIGLIRSTRYGFGCLWTALTFALARAGLIESSRCPRSAEKGVK